MDFVAHAYVEEYLLHLFRDGLISTEWLSDDAPDREKPDAWWRMLETIEHDMYASGIQGVKTKIWQSTTKTHIFIVAPWAGVGSLAFPKAVLVRQLKNIFLPP